MLTSNICFAYFRSPCAGVKIDTVRKDAALLWIPM